MTINLGDELTITNLPDLDYPTSSFKDSSSPTSTDGSALIALWLNDREGFFQAVTLAAGITVSGVPDTARVSQTLEGLRTIMGQTAGSVRIVTVTGGVLATDSVIVVSAPGANTELIFLAAADITATAVEIIRDTADTEDFTVTLTPFAGDTVGDEASITLLPGEGYKFIPDGGTNFIQR